MAKQPVHISCCNRKRPQQKTDLQRAQPGHQAPSTRSWTANQSNNKKVCLPSCCEFFSRTRQQTVYEKTWEAAKLRFLLEFNENAGTFFLLLMNFFQNVTVNCQFHLKTGQGYVRPISKANFWWHVLFGQAWCLVWMVEQRELLVRLKRAGKTQNSIAYQRHLPRKKLTEIPTENQSFILLSFINLQLDGQCYQKIIIHKQAKIQWILSIQLLFVFYLLDLLQRRILIYT